jgi:hypothetical protein
VVLDVVARGYVLLRGVPSPMPTLKLRLMRALMPMREATTDVDAALILYGAIGPRRQRASVRCICAVEQLGGDRAGDEPNTLTATSGISAVNGADVADSDGEIKTEIADGNRGADAALCRCCHETAMAETRMHRWRWAMASARPNRYAKD